MHCHDSARGTRITDMVENGTSKYFTYDSMGNMTTYKGSSATSAQNLYWTRGNMLWSGSVKAGKNFSYQYGPDNLRYKKTVNNTETLYFWDGDTLIGESDGVNDTQYVYDGSGIAGMLYNGAFLYFEKNLFGDVLKAYNMSGTEVASFTYDSYGNILSQSGSLAHAVKMRYRGYYWDEETGFYYLQSRYYDPSICRFISADQYELVGILSDSLGGLNLYAYCANNPIMFTDPTGYLLEWAIGGEILIKAFIVIVSIGAIIYIENTYHPIENLVNWISNLYVNWKGIGGFNDSVWEHIWFSDKSGKVTPPKWVHKGMVNPNESPSQNADRIMKERYGSYKKGPGSEHNIIKKWIEWLFGGRGRGGRGGPKFA